MVAVAVRENFEDEVLSAPGGRWRDVLRGEERSFASSERLARVVDELGVGVFERL
jgi:hypothetical protein